MGQIFIFRGKRSSNYLIYIHSPMEKICFLQVMVKHASCMADCSRVDPASCNTVDALGWIVSCAGLYVPRPLVDCVACMTMVIQVNLKDLSSFVL